MKRMLYLVMLAMSLSLASGCSLGQDCYDYTYNAFGGRWQRDDMLHGRVGSIIDPGGGPVEVGEPGEVYFDDFAAESELLAPTPADG